MRSGSLAVLAGAALVLGSLACSDAGVGGGAAVGLAFSTRAAPSGAAGGTMSASVAQAGDSTIVVVGDDSVIIGSVELVLREIELRRSGVTSCSMSDGSDDDQCEEFSTGIQLVSLPLGNGTEQVVTVNVPAGTYDQVEFEIHKPEDSADAAFIAAHPDFDGVSIRVMGRYSQAGTSTSFVYTTDLSEEQEIQLDPLLDVAADGPANVTIRLDIATWFLNDSRSALVDPSTANIGGPNEGVVRNNIEQSIEAFHDNDHDGLDDSHEDDDHGTDPDHP